MDFKLKLSEKKQLNLNVYLFTFLFENRSSFLYDPGQFIVMELNDSEGTFMRSYSIYSETDQTISFLIKLVDGRGSNVLRDMKEDTSVVIRGPVGNFTLRALEKQNIFIGVGTGIAPLLNMIDAIEDKSSVTLLVGQRTEDDLFLLGHLENLKKQGVRIMLSLTQPTDKWGGLTGRVYEHLDQFPTVEVAFYVCGSEQMTNDVINVLVGRGVDPEKIYRERFY